MSRLDLTGLARVEIPPARRREIEAEARALGARIYAARRVMSADWRVVVSGAGRPPLVLHGYGPLEAVIAGALEDWQAAA